MNYNNNFEDDLRIGQVAERNLGYLFDNSAVEVKRDFLALKTGNVYIEYESRGKSSGLARTKADWYAFVLSEEVVIFIRTEKLKEICRVKGEIKLGGDNNTSKGIVLPIKNLYDEN
tara:strand:+ start:1156 stop:1503 length:348 start_codon:yes stop_codon:yes gene_type:complete